MMPFMGPTEVIERRKASQKAKRAEKTAAIRRLLWDKQEGRCAYCCKSIALESCEVDHVIARAKGGRNEITNYAIACTSCNNMKLDLDVYTFTLRLLIPHTCRYCGGIWVSRLKRPMNCRHCGSYRWDKDRKIQTK